MRYFRCRCGETAAWSSMGVNRCASCWKCGSDLAESPEQHGEPADHEFTSLQEVETDEGTKTLHRCRYCHRSRGELEKAKKLEQQRGGS